MRTNRSIRVLMLPILASATVVGSAAGQNGDAPGSQDAPLGTRDPRWTLRIEPSIWYVAPSGDLRMPSDTTKGDEVKAEDLNLDTPRVSPLIEVHIRPSARWRFTASGFGFSIDRGQTMRAGGRVGDVAFGAGDRLESELEFVGGEVSAGYAIIEEHDVNGDPALRFGLDLVGGARFSSIDWKVSRPGGASDSTDEFFAEPILGARGDLTIVENFTIDLQTTFGYMPAGDHESFSWDIMVGFAWRPVHWIGVQVGYRNIFFDFQSGSGADEFSWDGGLAGLVAGVELRF